MCGMLCQWASRAPTFTKLFQRATGAPRRSSLQENVNEAMKPSSTNRIGLLNAATALVQRSVLLQPQENENEAMRLSLPIAELAECSEALHPNVKKLLPTFPTLTVSTTTAERSFETLKWYKTHLHHSIAQEGLASLALCVSWRCRWPRRGRMGIFRKTKDVPNMPYDWET